MASTSASRLGGLARVRAHGNPGTPAGRRKGGLQSLNTHRKLKTGFKLLRKVRVPKDSAALAELFGIMAGDGHISAYQASVTTNLKTDYEHARHVARLFAKAFGSKPALLRRESEGAVVVRLSSKAACDFLCAKGLVKGHKIRARLSMPAWIARNRNFRRAFIRGLFDTDGSVYMDRHMIRGREYRNICMLFSNRCLPLLAGFKQALHDEGLHPTQRTEYAVFLRRKAEVYRFFSIFGSSNPKHLGKVRAYRARKQGGVA